MSTFDCAAFDRRLDEGASLDDAMRAHAASCERCTAALAAMAELDALLAEAPAAPEGFTEAVMARVMPRHAAAPANEPALEPSPAPWWLDILLQPAVVLSTLLLALVVWRARALFAAAEAGAAWLATAAGGLDTGHVLSAHAFQWAALGLALGFAPALGFAMYALSGWVVRWAAPRLSGTGS